MNSIEQLLHDAMTEQTEGVPHLRPGTARRSVARSRRARRSRVAAVSAATVAATAGVSVLAISLQGGAATGSAGSPGSPLATAAPRTALPVSPAVSATPETAPASDDGSKVNRLESEAPDELKAVTLTGPIAGLTVMGMPSGVPGNGPSYSISDSGKWSKGFWFHPEGTQDSSGAVIVTAGVERPVWNQDQSPSPAVSPVNVHGNSGTVWLSGGDREIYYSAGDLTVEVFASDNNITLEQMGKIADAVQGLPQ